MFDRRWQIAATAGGAILLLSALTVPTATGVVLVFALFVGVVAALLLGWSVLDPDVSHAAVIGSLIGFALDYASGLPFDEFGFAQGAVVGALIGDIVRETRTERLADASYQGGIRWWQQRMTEPLWFARIAWSLALVALSLTVIMTWIYGVQTSADQNVLLGDLLSDMVVARGALSPTELLRRGWPVYVLLSLAILACSRLWFRRLTPWASDRLLRRIAVLHCLSLMLLSWRIIAAWSPAVFELQAGLESTPMDWRDERIRGLALLLVESQVPLLAMVMTMSLLGSRLWRYLRQFGWMAALGFTGWISAAWLGWHLSYVAKLME